MGKALQYRIKGFTLLEVLVAIIILSLGILGVSHITGGALHEISENEARSMALHAATKDLEPLYIAANNGMVAFKETLEHFDTDKDDIFNDITITQSNSKYNYTLFITAATDNSSQPKNILTDKLPSTWQSPITIGVKVMFQGKYKVKTARAPFVFIIS